MKVFIVYCHPDPQSFTRRVLDIFLEALKRNGHPYQVSDLTAMNFQSDLSSDEYAREAFYRDDLPLHEDVMIEQSKINWAQVLVFIYPVFWTEAPARLVGWFDRVWSYGFAYGPRSMKLLDKVIFLCTTGHSLENLKGYGHWDAMRTVMVGDRIHDRARSVDFIVLDGMARQNMDLRNRNIPRHLETVRRIVAELQSDSILDSE